MQPFADFSRLIVAIVTSDLPLDKHFLAQAGDGSWGDHQRGVVRGQRVTAQRFPPLWRQLHRQAHQVQEGMSCQDTELLSNFSTRLPSSQVGHQEEMKLRFVLRRLTFTVCQPVDVFPPRDGGLLWILADLHFGPLVHLHQLANVDMKRMKVMERSCESACRVPFFASTLPCRRSPATAAWCR